MRLAQLQVSLPVLQVESEVTYQVPRRPTAIENMILQVCTKFAGHTTFGGQSLVQHFKEWLCVSDAALFVVPSLEDLIELEVLKNPGNTSLADAKVRDLAITARGQKMLQLGKLPGSPQQAAVKHVFDPVCGTLRLQPAGKQPAGLTEGPVSARPDPESFLHLDPTPEVREQLPKEKHAWWGPNTHLDEVACHVAEQVLWLGHDLEIHVDPVSGALQATVPATPAVGNWLGKLDPDTAWDQILSHAFGGEQAESVSGGELPMLRLEGAQAASPDRRLPDLLRESQRAAVCVTWGAMPPSSPFPAKSALHVYLEPGRKTPQLEWNPAGDGARLRLPVGDAKPGLVAWWMPSRGQNAVAWSRGNVAVKWGGSEHLVTLAVRASNAEAEKQGAPLLAMLGKAVEHCEPLGSSLPALWEPIEKVIERAIPRITGTLRERADAAAAFRKRVEAITGTKIPATLWDALVRTLLEGAVTPTLPASAVPDAVRAPRDAGLMNREPFVTALLARAAAPANLQELRAIQAACDPGVEIPSRLFTPAIIRSIVDETFRAGVSVRGSSPVDRAAQNARAALEALSVQLKVDPAKLVDEATCQSVLAGLRKPALESLARWRESAGKLRQFAADPATFDRTRFASVESGVARLQQYLGRLHDLGPGTGSPVVIDTNALIDYPDLLSHLEPGQVPVLPKRVLDELDGKKRDARVADNVAKAIRAISSAGSRIRYIDGDMELLPLDFGVSGDNLILSVAMRLMVFDPLLLTADRNLQNKARAQGLRFEAPTAFVSRREQVAPAPSSKSSRNAQTASMNDRRNP